MKDLQFKAAQAELRSPIWISSSVLTCHAAKANVGMVFIPCQNRGHNVTFDIKLDPANGYFGILFDEHHVRRTRYMTPSH
jgi:hypothetical protein